MVASNGCYVYDNQQQDQNLLLSNSYPIVGQDVTADAKEALQNFQESNGHSGDDESTTRSTVRTVIMATTATLPMT